MSLIEFFQKLNTGSVLGGFGATLVVIMTLLQIVPIKVNPWTWVARKLGRAFNGEMHERMDRLEKDLKEIKTKDEERRATDCRSAILRFGDELRRGVLHSKEHFDQILLDISFYEHYCDTHKDYANNIALMTIEKIKDTYRKCMDEDSFL